MAFRKGHAIILCTAVEDDETFRTLVFYDARARTPDGAPVCKPAFHFWMLFDVLVGVTINQ